VRSSSLLQRGGGGIMSQRGSVIVDRTNTIILKELPTYIDTVLAIIDTLDVPEPQVMIEARIVETTKQFSRSLGISWGFDGEAARPTATPPACSSPTRDRQTAASTCSPAAPTASST
jgi:type II secretory pathway component HofQ